MPLFRRIKKIYHFSSKVLIIIGTFTTIIILFLSFSNKNRTDLSQTSHIQSVRADIYKTLEDPQYKQTLDGKIAMGVYRGIMCNTIGEACTNNPSDGDRNYQNTFFGMASNLLVVPFANPPASGTFYAIEKFNQAGLFPKIYAAEGVGFTSLKVFESIWKTFRDLTFLVLVLIIVAIGFMIMFRMKLDPHTVVSLENALPKVILTMVLITFSYAIAGFLIDMMYVSIVFVVNVLAKAGQYDATATSTMFITDNFWGLSNIQGNSLIAEQFRIYFRGLFAIFEVLPNVIKGVLYVFVPLFGLWIALKTGGFLNPLIANIFGNASGTASFFTLVGGEIKFGNIAAALIAISMGLILAPAIILLLIAFLVFLGLFLIIMRIFFVLLAAYIQVLVQIMFAPIFLIIEAIPGQKGFVPWLRKLIGNLAVFPATAGLLLIVGIININILKYEGLPFQGTNTPMFIPPFIAATPNAFLAIINAAFLVMIPDFLKLIKQTIIGKDAGFNMGPGALFAGTIGGVVGGGMGALTQFHSVGAGLGGIAPFLPKKLLHTDPHNPDSDKTFLGKLLSMGRSH